MKKPILLIALIATMTLFVACGDDDDDKKVEVRDIEFTVGDQTFSLDDADVYLYSISDANYLASRADGAPSDSHTDYLFTITDGSEADYYYGESIYIEFYLTVPKGNTLEAGSYPATDDYELGANDNASYITAYINIVNDWETYETIWFKAGGTVGTTTVSGSLTGGDFTIDMSAEGQYWKDGADAA